jgi:uncharacterized protein (TIGR00730 family)
MAKLNVAVFCSSSESVSPLLLSEAESFGAALASRGHRVVYGGCDIGMMGRLADGALKAGGEVIGVVPELDWAAGIVHTGLTSRVAVPTLSERKIAMLERADAAVALPGGLGTLDEIFEALVLKATGQWRKPFWFINWFDFWTPTLEALTLMSESRMINHPLHELYDVVERHEDLLRALEGTTGNVHGLGGHPR